MEIEVTMPAVSVIIPAHNCKSTLGGAVQSAQRQSLRDIEIIVADDGSFDGTYEYAQSLAALDPRIVCMRLPKNGGVSAARNAAIELAKGQWVAVLDADDWYEPERLEFLLKAAHDLDADLVGDNLKIYDHAREAVVDQTCHGSRGGPTALTPEFLFLRDTPLRMHAIGYVKPFMRREFLGAHNIRYNTAYRTGEDFFLLAETTLTGGKAFLIPEAFYVYRHRISPTTRRISPHSRSEAGFAATVQACDELALKYGNSMSSAARKALQHKRGVFESRIKCGEMLDAIRKKRLFYAACILLERPFILVLIMVTAGKYVHANMRAVASGFRKMRPFVNQSSTMIGKPHA